MMRKRTVSLVWNPPETTISLLRDTCNNIFTLKGLEGSVFTYYPEINSNQFNGALKRKPPSAWHSTGQATDCYSRNDIGDFLHNDQISRIKLIDGINFQAFDEALPPGYRKVILTEKSGSMTIQPIHQLLRIRSINSDSLQEIQSADTLTINTHPNPIFTIIENQIEQQNKNTKLGLKIQSEEDSIDDDKFLEENDKLAAALFNDKSEQSIEEDFNDENCFSEEEEVIEIIEVNNVDGDDFINDEEEYEADEDQLLNTNDIPSNTHLHFVTPQLIIENLHHLQEELRTDHTFNLTKAIKSLSFIPNRHALFIPFETGRRRLTQIYKCCCYLTHQCPAFISFKYKNNTLALRDENHFHNHLITELLRKGKSNSGSIPQATIQKIQEFTELGLSPGAIRLKLRLTLSPKRLYEIRRPILRLMQHIQAFDLQNEVHNWNGWATQINTNNGIFHSFYGVNLQHANQDYSRYINIMDDTAKTNFFQLPLFAIITPDYNEKSRLLAFGILNSRKSTEIKAFLRYLLQFTGTPPKFIIIDRYMSQISAIEEVFNPQSLLYCRLHIATNVRDVIKDREFLELFWKLAHNQCSEEVFLSKLFEIRNQTKLDKVRSFIDSLMNEIERWLPTQVDPSSKIYVTSRVEGFFGRLKTETNHQLLPLKDLCVLIKVLSEIEPDEQLSDKLIINELQETIKHDRIELGESETLSFNYNDLQATFEPYFSSANRNVGIQQILSKTVTSLQETTQSTKNEKVSIQNPPMIKQSGVQELYPAKKSHLCGAKKTKITYHCSICNSKWHNKNRCPKNQSQDGQ
jgi:hypothetical protein